MKPFFNNQSISASFTFDQSVVFLQTDGQEDEDSGNEIDILECTYCWQRMLFTDLKYRVDRASTVRKWSQRKLSTAVLLEPPWDPIVHVTIEKKIIWILPANDMLSCWIVKKAQFS